MKVVVASIYLALVTCAQGQATSSKYLRRFNTADSRRRVHRRIGGGDFFVPDSIGQASSKFEDWRASGNSLGEGGSSTAFSLSRPISTKGSSLPISNLGTSSYRASASSGGVGSLNKQQQKTNNNFRGWGTAGGLSNHGSSGINYQGWTPLDDASGETGNSYLPGSTKQAGAFSFPVSSSGAGNYRISSTNGGAGTINNQGNGGVSSSNFKGWSAGASSLSDPFGGVGNLNPASTSYSTFSTGGSNFQGYSGSFSTSSNQGGNGGGSGSNFKDNSASASTISYHGSNEGGSFQDNGASASDVSYQGSNGLGSYQDSSVSASNSNYEGGYVSGTQDYSSHGEYQSVAVGAQTSEGKDVDQELLQQIRQILIREEDPFGGDEEIASKWLQAAYGAPSSSYGAPSSEYGAPTTGHSGIDRVVGVSFEGIDQSILIAEYHQTDSDSSSLEHGSSSTLAIPSGQYGAPY